MSALRPWVNCTFAIISLLLALYFAIAALGYYINRRWFGFTQCIVCTIAFAVLSVLCWRAKP